jgi:hypothetical protein
LTYCSHHHDHVCCLHRLTGAVCADAAKVVTCVDSVAIEKEVKHDANSTRRKRGWVWTGMLTKGVQASTSRPAMLVLLLLKSRFSNH